MKVEKTGVSMYENIVSNKFLTLKLHFQIHYKTARVFIVPARKAIELFNIKSLFLNFQSKSSRFYSKLPKDLVVLFQPPPRPCGMITRRVSSRSDFLWLSVFAFIRSPENVHVILERVPPNLSFGYDLTSW